MKTGISRDRIMMVQHVVCVTICMYLCLGQQAEGTDSIDTGYGADADDADVCREWMSD